MPDDHKCLHESDWAIFKDHQSDMARDLKMVLKILRGNGEDGLLTKFALQTQCVKKLHKRLDKFEAAMIEISKKASQCDDNTKSIVRIWKVLTWVGGPTTLALWAGIIKYLFFGG
jgi:hypothetical protein